jgi:transcriptional regulator with XRE-family HTH domain
MMPISDTIAKHLEETGMSQRELAEKLYVDRSFISRVKNGERKWPESLDVNLARVSWRLALHLADERTGGYISYILEDVPNLDLHPAALKELLLKELQEAGGILEEIRMARHIDPEKRKEKAKQVWHEVTDVMEVASVFRGVIEEEFELDRDRLVREHEMQRKKGER